MTTTKKTTKEQQYFAAAAGRWPANIIILALDFNDTQLLAVVPAAHSGVFLTSHMSQYHEKGVLSSIHNLRGSRSSGRPKKGTFVGSFHSPFRFYKC